MEKIKLYPYQEEAVSWLEERGSGLLAHSVGLGKTIISLEYLRRTKPDRVLILCPAILRWQWAREAERFFPPSLITVVEGTAEERRRLWRGIGTGIWIANYELLLRDGELMALEPWDIIICDEATRIHNIRTKTRKVLKKFEGARRIALTGTPVSNRPDELFGIIDWVSPGSLGNYYAFLDRYCVKNYWGAVVNYRGLDELAERVRPFMLRRRKEEVLPELPERITCEVPFVLSDEERDVHRKIKEEILYELTEGELSKIENPYTMQNAMTKLLRLRMAADSLELLGDKNTSTKLTVLQEVLHEAMEEDPIRKGIVFTSFAGMARILERELASYGPLTITGSVPGPLREGILKAFKEKQEHRLLISTSAGELGLNLQEASVVVHYDLEWSLAKLEQRVGRVHRIGAKRSVLEYVLLGKGTADMYVRRLLVRKEKLSSELLGDPVLTRDTIKDIAQYE